ncbi:substrate-binding periplasmic protein [Glaciecola sp. 2405UD65-10]|uniref:substrate-binding periplasmic protein n=1 Tax=Glaciecola sp. 2405UD65-10 TaxID=3397244 RepID=UPI003B5B24B5
MMKVCLLVILLLGNITISQSQESWVVYSRNYYNPYLQEQLSAIASKLTSTDQTFEFVPSADMEQGRAFAELQKGNIDIFIGAPTRLREAQARLIPVPLDRGLLGFRICLIQKGDKRFQNITSIADFKLKPLKIGVGSHWPDRQIYEENGLKIVASPVRESLFTMLHNKRFDCFSRSVNEISNEFTQYKDLNIEIDQDNVLIYPLGDFIFVNQHNRVLVERLEQGLQETIESGDFLSIFNKYYADELRKFTVFERKILFLRNNNLSNAAAQGINKYGIASFLHEAIKSHPTQASSLSKVSNE